MGAWTRGCVDAVVRVRLGLVYGGRWFVEVAAWWSRGVVCSA